jgi:hypothetical protein
LDATDGCEEKKQRTEKMCGCGEALKLLLVAMYASKSPSRYQHRSSQFYNHRILHYPLIKVNSIIIDDKSSHGLPKDFWAGESVGIVAIPTRRREPGVIVFENSCVGIPEQPSSSRKHQQRQRSFEILGVVLGSCVDGLFWKVLRFS